MKRTVGISWVVFLIFMLVAMLGARQALADSSAARLLWSKSYGGKGGDFAYALVQTSDGGYALTGETYSFGTRGDFWLVKTDAFGIMQWDQTFGGTNDDGAHALVQTTDGGYALAGYTESFGAGSDDACLVRTDAGVAHASVASQFPFLLTLGVVVGFFVAVILLIVIRTKRKSKVGPK